MKNFRTFSISVIILLLIGIPLRAEVDIDLSEIAQKLSGLKVEGLYYLSYNNGIDQTGSEFNQFSVNRGYTTLKKSVLPFMDSRITLDAHQDATGDMKVRVKYVYANFKFDKLGFITKPNIEFGLVHTPWLDFEEHINYYRMQGTMFMERVGIFNSGDFGVTFGGYLGGEMSKDFKKSVNSKYAGRYGSFAFGVYNGGGYHATDANDKLIAQARLSLRPVPEIIPGFQASYLGIFGTGNMPNAGNGIPEWQTNGVMISHENAFSTLTATYIFGGGNKSGSASWYDVAGDPYDYEGLSMFCEFKPGEHWKGIGRIDYFDPNADGSRDISKRYIAGVGYDFDHHNILILDWDYLTSENAGVQDAKAVKLTMQVHF